MCLGRPKVKKLAIDIAVLRRYTASGGPRTVRTDKKRSYRLNRRS